MNIEQLEYIVNISRTGSISATAEAMHISQAGISKAVMKLESEIGFGLFRRTRYGTLPTERGKALIEKAEEILAKIHELKDEISGQYEQIHGDVKLSVSPNFIAILPKSIVLFKISHPYVKLEITEKDSIEIMEDIKHNRADLGLIYFPPDMDSMYSKILSKVALIETKLVVCVSKNSVLAHKKKLYISKLLEQTFVSVNGSFSSVFMERLTSTYGSVEVIFTSTNQEILKRTIAEGDAIGIFMEINIMKDPLILNGDIVAIPLETEALNYNVITLGYIRSKQQPFSRAHQELIRHIQDQIKLSKS